MRGSTSRRARRWWRWARPRWPIRARASASRGSSRRSWPRKESWVQPDLVVALDLPTLREALALVDALGADVTWYKVGPVLFVSDGPALVRELRARGKKVFVDLKWHDSPRTVG